MPVNSRQKGKRGEREAAEYLRSICFDDAQRTQQYNGLGKSDVVCPKSLPLVHIEVKFAMSKKAGYWFGCKGWYDAIEQAVRDCPTRSRWCVLWRPQGVRVWFCTFESLGRMTVTVTGDDGIRSALHMLQSLAERRLKHERVETA